MFAGRDSDSAFVFVYLPQIISRRVRTFFVPRIWWSSPRACNCESRWSGLGHIGDFMANSCPWLLKSKTLCGNRKKAGDRLKQHAL